MKRLITYLMFGVLLFSACMPPPLTLVPPETLAAQTMAAMPKTDTPIPSATFTLSPLPSETPTFTPDPVLSAAGAACVSAIAERARGLVTRVFDAETIEVAVGNTTLKVRYIGLDAPGVLPMEWQGPLAIQANERLVSGKMVILVRDVSDLDANGLAPRYVFADGIFVNYEMVRQGFARALSMPPDTACDNTFLIAQNEAQAAQLGVWVPTPLPTFTSTNTALPATLTRTATSTLQPVCDCSDPRLHRCAAYPTQADAQACYNYCLAIGYGPILEDQNRNGKVCEGLP